MTSSSFSPVVPPAATVALAQQPAYTLTDPVNVKGCPRKRRMIVLRTNGCAYDRNKAGCIMCDFIAHAIPQSRLRVGAPHLVHQLRDALAPVHHDCAIAQVDLLTLGSFFHDLEVTPHARRSLLSTVADISQVQRIVVESRAPYVSPPVLSAARACIRQDQRLELGLGIETSNDHVRNSILRKGLQWADVGATMQFCRDSDVDFLAYLLVKPPGLTEHEAIDDAVRSARDVVALAAQIGVAVRLAFEPVFVTSNTLLHTMFEQGNYVIGNLWTTVEVVKQCHGLAPLFIGLSDEGLSSGRFPRGCARCDGPLRRALRAYNGSQQLCELNLDCGECRASL